MTWDEKYLRKSTRSSSSHSEEDERVDFGVLCLFCEWPVRAVRAEGELCTR